MRLGYPTINTTIGCKANSRFRLASYTEERMRDVVENNLACLEKILRYNLEHGLLFFRISSDLIPFASHPICKFDWMVIFRKRFESIGDFIKDNNMRISMHPGQYVLLNSKDENIISRSIAELAYHCNVLDSLGLDQSAKIQIHIGGVYGDRVEALKRFVSAFQLLEERIRRRLVIENDDRLFRFADCQYVHSKIQIPIVFDVFHHKLLNNGESLTDAIKHASYSWGDSKNNGILMVDYSDQKAGEMPGAHSDFIDVDSFRLFLQQTAEIDFDLMLEVKSKEKSALEARTVIDSMSLAKFQKPFRAVETTQASGHAKGRMVCRIIVQYHYEQ